MPDDRRKEPSYLKQLSLVAPAFAAKAIVGDLPKGAVESATESHFRGDPRPFSTLLRKGFAGRGGGRAVGGVLGIATAPLYLKGVRMARSKDPAERAKGVALLGGTGGVYAGQKGLNEGFAAARAAGSTGKAALLSGLRLGATRAAFKAPLAMYGGLSFAKSLNDRDKAQSSLEKHLVPVVSGAGIGATSRLAEESIPKLLGKKLTMKRLIHTLGHAAPAMMGGAAGGALGGLVLTHVTDAAEKALKKEGSVSLLAQILAEMPEDARPYIESFVQWSPYSIAELTKTAQASKESVTSAPERQNDVPSMKGFFKPMPHQEEAVQKLFENRGKLILAHQMGAGKTVTAIYGFEKMRQQGKAQRALVVVPSGLRENFARDGVEKFTGSTFQIIGSREEKSRMKGYVRPDELKSDKTYTVVSYEMFRRDPIGMMQRAGADTLVADEFHKVRNDHAQIYRAMQAARPLATNFIGITGSLINNAPEEIAKLVSISEGGPALGTPREFSARFTKTIGTAKGFGNGTKKIRGINRPGEFAMSVVPKVDYFETSDLPGAAMPRKDVKNVYVPMSDEQYKLYQMSLRRLGPVSDYIARRDPHISLKEADKLFTQIMQARQISNSIGMGRSDVSLEQSVARTPKVSRLIADAKQHLAEQPDNGVVLYSNLVRGGVDVLSAGLKREGIPHALFVGAGTEVGEGKVTNVSRSEGVSQFKAGKKRAIIVSGAGAEGLDLKNATAFFALDGHFNPERIMQAEARARRLGGLAHRPPEKRVVDVRRYQSVVPDNERPGLFGKLMGKQAPQTTDEWAYNVAGRKFQTSRQFYDVLHKPSKYIRKENYVRRDGTQGVRYKYTEQLQQPRGLFRRLFGPKEDAAPAPVFA